MPLGGATADTSRPLRESEADGESYWFMDIDQMEEEIADNRFLESGRFEENYYGTKFDSIRSVVESGRMCVLDVNPQVGGATAASDVDRERRRHTH